MNPEKRSIDDYYTRPTSPSLSNQQVVARQTAKEVTTIDIDAEVKSEELLEGRNAMTPIARFRQNRIRTRTKVKATEAICEIQLSVLAERLHVLFTLDKTRIAALLQTSRAEIAEAVSASCGASRNRITESQLENAMETLRLMDRHVRMVDEMDVSEAEKKRRCAPIIELCNREYAFLLSGNFLKEYILPLGAGHV